MVTLNKSTTPSSLERDAVFGAIRKALRAAQAARMEGYGDVRISSTACTDYLDYAVTSLENAVKWMGDYQKEVRADERRSLLVLKTAAKLKEECHICETEIEPDDLAVCGGCDKPTCPECVGDDGICKDCEAEE